MKKTTGKIRGGLTTIWRRKKLAPRMFVCSCGQVCDTAQRAALGLERRTSRKRSENHTSRLSIQLTELPARSVLKTKPSPHGQEHLRLMCWFVLTIIVAAKTCLSDLTAQPTRHFVFDHGLQQMSDALPSYASCRSRCWCCVVSCESMTARTQ